jgi:hypothetical protein
MYESKHFQYIHVRLIDIAIIVLKVENIMKLIDTNVGSLGLAKDPSSRAEQHFDYLRLALLKLCCH